MLHRPVAAVIGLVALSASAVGFAQPLVQVDVQWLPDPARAVDWDHAGSTQAGAEERATDASPSLHPELANFYELLNRVGQDAVNVVLADVGDDVRPVELARLVADEVPFSLEALCADADDEWQRSCAAVERYGFTSIGVKVPRPSDHSAERFSVVFGVRPTYKDCLIEMGCGDDG